MISSQDIFKYFKRAEKVLDSLNKSVKETVNTQGFKVIEDHIKKCLSDQYKSLMTCSPKDLPVIQTKISNTIDLMKTIYNMAGLEWNYDEAIDPKLLVQNEEETQSAFERARDDYFKKKEEIGNF